MDREYTAEAATVEEAIDAALEELGVQQDAVDYEVLEGPGRRIFGLGGDKNARVRVWVKETAIAEITEAKALAREILDVDDETIEASASVDVSEEPELTDEELDQVADAAVETLRQALVLLGVPDPKIEEYEGDEGEIILDVIGADLGLLIGRHGKTLDALQSLVAAVTTRRLGFRYPIVVDVEGYRHRRRQKIEDMARKSADRAARQRTAVKMRPMTAYERRVVHVALRNDNRVVTGSEGAEPFRQVVIKPR